MICINLFACGSLIPSALGLDFFETLHLAHMFQYQHQDLDDGDLDDREYCEDTDLLGVQSLHHVKVTGERDVYEQEESEEHELDNDRAVRVERT